MGYLCHRAASIASGWKEPLLHLLLTETAIPTLAAIFLETDRQIAPFIGKHKIDMWVGGHLTSPLRECWYAATMQSYNG